MKTNPDQFTLDCENYRIANGSGALYPYYGRKTGKLYIVKSQNTEEVVLTEVFGDSELQVTASELSSDFGMWFQDESVFLFGTKDQQATAHAQWDSMIEAMQRVLYARQVPMVV